MAYQTSLFPCSGKNINSRHMKEFFRIPTEAVMKRIPKDTVTEKMYRYC